MAAAVQEEAAPATSNIGPCVGRADDENIYLKNELQLELPKLICQGVRLSTPSDAIRSSPALPGPERTFPVESNANSLQRGRRTSPKILPNNADATNSTDEERKPVSLRPPPPPPACRRRLLCDFEKELTFRPKLNMLSVKLASHNARSNVPVVHRLLEVRKTVQDHYHKRHLTFAPKLNALSVRLAQERVSRMPEVQERLAQLTAARTAEVYAQYTFKPHISERSVRITEGLGTSFFVRQQKHMERRQKVMDEAYQLPPRQLSRSRRMVKLVPRVPPPANTKDMPPTKENQLCLCVTKSPCSNTQSPPPPTQMDTSESPSPDPQPSPPRRSHSTTPLHGTRPGGLPLQSPSRQSLREARSLHKHQRRKSAPISNKKSPVVGKSRGGRGAGSPQSKVMPSCAQAEVKFEDLNELDRVKRVRVVAERVMRAKKVFLCHGGYRTIRNSLRQRGWVQQEYTRTPSSQPNESPTKVLSPKKVGTQRLHRQSSHDNYPDSSSDGDSDTVDLGDEGSEEEYSDEEEYCMLSRAVRSCPPHFVWTLRRDDVLYRSMHREALANHFARASSFTTKVGLCMNLRNLRWYGDTDPDVFYPRCYRLSCDEEKEAFIDDYRFTTALCILKQLVQQYYTRTPATPTRTPTPPHTPSPVSQTSYGRPPSSPTRADRNETTSWSPSQASTTSHSLSKSGSRPPSTTSRAPSRAASTILTQPTVPEEAVGLALRACEAYLSSREHDDIEGSQLLLCPKLLNSEWDKLIQHFYSIVFEDARIVCGYHCVARAISTLDEMENHFPQLHMDGARNIWIIKPGALSRGRGIVCMDKLEDILELVSSSVQKKENKWVIQKYIEQPLLIYETKFDIRQWFLVTDWNPLTMWMYKECYLRFSTQRYTLDDLDVSVHLCNNSVQKHYQNSSTRSDLLPEENMWDSDTFKQYLSSCGRSDDWDAVIYPGMKQALISVLQVTQDEIEHRKNSFELYGADFMISEDFKPWLIEINCSPTMESSTAVTARMCRQVLEDTIKVVVDRREERDCDTGRFELAYKQPKLEMPAYVGIQLCVEGSSIPKPCLHKKAHKVAAPVIRLGYRSA